MAFLDKLSDLARNIGDKTGEAIETGKLNSKIRTEKTAVTECMRKIGEIYYAKYKAGEEADPDVSELYAEIDGHNTTIEETQTEIARIGAQAQPAPAPAAPVAGVVCQSCGAANAAGTKFCSACGTKLEIPAPPQDRFCPDCGAKLPAASRFCGECGHRFED